MKTTLALFLGALLAASLAGCGDGGGGDTKGGGGTTGTGATGGGGSTTSGPGGGGSTGTGTTGGDPSCDAYCAEVTANCTGDNSQYASADVCAAVCAHFEPGKLSDVEGATLGCHQYHGGTPAEMDPGTHCPHAGPLGGGACGADCDNFCDLAIKVCGGQATPPYADLEACKTACDGFIGTATVPYNANATAGDSLACRMYHLSVAATEGMAGMHCPHIAAASETCK